MASERILIIEDERLIRWSLTEHLENEGFEVTSAESGAEGMKNLSEKGADLVVLDYRLGDTTGIELLKKITEDYPDVLVVMMTAYGTIDRAVEAIKLGAFDYLNKPIDYDELVLVIRKALETTALRREVATYRSEQRKRYGLDRIIGDSPSMMEVFRMIEKIARSAATTVLVQGESGTGKDVVAKAIHYHSDRANQPFMTITCTALPETLLESELMGYEKGAFTDAKTLKRGLFEMAEGGTVFLDEIGDMGLSLQAKLLRFLEDKSFKRVGGTRDVTVDVRIIAATNRDLRAAVDEGVFRQDLYYRLKVVPIDLPALRERKEDIPLLIKFFIDQFNHEFKKNTQGVEKNAIGVLKRYHWPGNVRELKNVVERVMILESKQEITAEDLPKDLFQDKLNEEGGAAAFVRLPDSGVSIEDVERALIQQALERVDGNQTRAAQLLGLRRDALRYRMKKFGLL